MLASAAKISDRVVGGIGVFPVRSLSGGLLLFALLFAPQLSRSGEDG
jgi:hypothetical protein